MTGRIKSIGAAGLLLLADQTAKFYTEKKIKGKEEKKQMCIRDRVWEARQMPLLPHLSAIRQNKGWYRYYPFLLIRF